jgi:hypothetical protein
MGTRDITEMTRTARFMPFLPVMVVLVVGAMQLVMSGARSVSASSASFGQPRPLSAHESFGAPSAIRDPRGIMALADPKVAERVGVRPEVQEQIRSVVEGLDREIARYSIEEIDAWIERGGSKADAMPALTGAATPLTNRIKAMRIEANEKIRELLTVEERRRADHTLTVVASGGEAVPANPVDAQN